MRATVSVLLGLLLAANTAACARSADRPDEPSQEPKPTPGAVHTVVPETPDPAAHYLIYLHGSIIETQGRRPTHPDYGVYEYDEILDALAARGFQVISEARPAGTKVPAYAEKVAAQVRALVAAGVPAGHIGVAGHSKGGLITVGASSLLDPVDFAGVRYVVMAGCFRGGSPIRGLRLSGHILSIYDEADRLAGSCDTIFANAPGAEETNEIILHKGLGHGAFYRPMDEWLDPLTAWIGETG